MKIEIGVLAAQCLDRRIESIKQLAVENSVVDEAVFWTRQRQEMTHFGHFDRVDNISSNRANLGCVDGFDQDEAESKRDERAVILRRLLASKCDTLEAFELADSLFNACPCLVECFRKEGGHILGVGSIRDCRTYSALARGVAV